MENTVSYFLLLPAECAIASEVLEQYLPRSFIFVPDKAKPQEKAAEGVLIVVRFHRLGINPFQRSCHAVQLVYELGIGVNLVRFCGLGEPREADRISANHRHRAFHTERSAEQRALALS